jgi:peroxiredoxin
VLALAALVAAAFTLAPRALGPLEIGSEAPMTDRVMTATDGATTTLAEVAGKNGLLVVFTSNTCPWVKAWEGRYLTTAEEAAEHGLGMIAVNSNTAARERGESMADMRRRGEEKGYSFPYVLDENAELASAFGASRTPDVFLFDEDMTLVYRGAIDDNARDPEAVESRYLSDAMSALVGGAEIVPTVTKSIGCTIKFGE